MHKLSMGLIFLLFMVTACQPAVTPTQVVKKPTKPASAVEPSGSGGGAAA